MFDEAEEVAERLGLSRSELYAKAVEAFVSEYRRKGVTEALDKVYSKHPSRMGSRPRQDAVRVAPEGRVVDVKRGDI